MATMHLTEISIRALKGSDSYVTYFDESTPGFGVRVGKRSKTYVAVRGQSRERISIGKVGDISLASARQKARQLLSADRAVAERKVPRISFAAARDEFLDDNYRGSTSDWPSIVKAVFKKHFKALDGKQLAEVTDGDVQSALDKIEGPSARVHAFRILRTFMRWATRPPRRYLRHSPLEGYESPGKDRKGTRTLSDVELKTLWNFCEKGSRRVFQLLMLWGTRSGETAVAEREWVKDGIIFLPGSVTKNGRDHAIPIQPLAQSVLDSLPEAEPYFFPGQRSSAKSLRPGSLPEMLKAVMKDAGLSGFTTRDLRRTFRSNMARLKVPREVCEVLLNHAPPVLDEIYDRYDRLDEKREALAKHEAFVVRLLAQGT